MAKITKEIYEQAIKDGFTEFEATHGYGNFYNEGDGFHVERIDSMNVFPNDDEARYYSITDGRALYNPHHEI